MFQENPALKEKRHEVLELCEKSIHDSQTIETDATKHLIIQKLANQIGKRANIIKEICSVEKYSLNFNGRVGLGKSTAICTLFGLLNDEKLEKGIKFEQAKLLKTGTGRSTLCETSIVQSSDSSYIEIEKMPYEGYEELINQFCYWLGNEKSTISDEEIRTVKNMAGIDEDLVTPDEIKINILCKNDNIQAFLLDKIAYENRNQYRFDFNANTDTSFKTWLKNTYKNINDGLVQDAPIPSKFSLFIAPDDIILSMPSFISKIVDTKGIDDGNRQDILLQMQQLDTLCLMCDEINAFGSNPHILNLLEQSLIRENNDICHRVITVGIEKGIEFDDNITIEKKKKITEAKRIYVNNNINFADENFIFYNNAPGIKVQDRVITDVNLLEKEHAQNAFFRDIEKRLIHMYSKYYDEQCEALKRLNQLSMGDITTKTLGKFRKCEEYINNAKSKAIEICDDTLERFDIALTSIYHTSLWGAVNRNGIGKTANVYAYFQKCGGDQFHDICNILKSNALALIDELFKDCDEMEEICYNSIVDEINTVYSKTYDHIRAEFFRRTSNKLQNNESWAIQKTYWGSGLGGYTKRVSNSTLNSVRVNHLDTELASLRIVEHYFNEILEFLCISST